MTRTEWLADRCDLLAEAEAIGVDLAAFEQRRGRDAETINISTRLQMVRVGVLTQLLAALLAIEGGETVH